MKAGKAQLTVYADRPLLETGGTVVVVSKPVALTLWNALPESSASETWQDNPQRSALGVHDRLLEVHVSGRGAIVEFVYPKGGTFGFDIVAAPTANHGMMFPRSIFSGRRQAKDIAVPSGWRPAKS